MRPLCQLERQTGRVGSALTLVLLILSDNSVSLCRSFEPFADVLSVCSHFLSTSSIN